MNSIEPGGNTSVPVPVVMRRDAQETVSLARQLKGFGEAFPSTCWIHMKTSDLLVVRSHVSASHRSSTLHLLVPEAPVEPFLLVNFMKHMGSTVGPTHDMACACHRKKMSYRILRKVWNSKLPRTVTRRVHQHGQCMVFLQQ